MSQYTPEELETMANNPALLHRERDALTAYAATLRQQAARVVDVVALRELNEWLRAQEGMHVDPDHVAEALTSALAGEQAGCQHDWAIGYGVPPYCNKCGDTMPLPTSPTDKDQR